MFPYVTVISEFPRADSMHKDEMYISLEAVSDDQIPQVINMLAIGEWIGGSSTGLGAPSSTSNWGGLEIRGLVLGLFKYLQMYILYKRQAVEYRIEYVLHLNSAKAAEDPASVISSIPKWTSVSKPCPKCGMQMKMLFVTLYCPSCGYE
jgi:hypothetical protein